MNLKLIKQDNFSGKMIAINPANIKQISLDYEIIKCKMAQSKLDDIRTNMGILIYEGILNDIKYIDYKWEDGSYTYEKKNEQEKAEMIYMLILELSAIGTRGINHLLRLIKENKEKPEIDDEIKTNIIYPLGQQKILKFLIGIK